jgi:hypothetical protein
MYCIRIRALKSNIFIMYLCKQNIWVFGLLNYMKLYD